MMMLLSERTLTGKLIFLTLALFSFFLPLHFFTSTVLLAAASLFFLISLCFREARLALHFAAAPRLRNLYIVLFLFALWRLFYGARTDGQSDVFASVRGVWFLLIPALIYFYASSRSRLYTLVTFFLAASAFAVLGNVWSTRAIFLEHPLQSFTATPATLYATAFVLLLGVVEASFFANHKVRGSVAVGLAVVVGLSVWATQSAGVLPIAIVTLFFFIYLQLFHRGHRAIYCAAVLILAVIAFFQHPEAFTWLNWAFFTQIDIALTTALQALYFSQVWLVYGWVGFVLLSIAFFYGIVLYTRSRFRMRLSSDRALTAAVAVAIPLLLVASFIEKTTTNETIKIMLWFMTGVLFALLERDRAGS